MLGSGSHCPKFVLNHSYGDVFAPAADDSAKYDELQRGYVVQQHRPVDRELEVQSDGEWPVRLEKDPAARYVDRPAGARVKLFSAADQFPAHWNADFVAPVVTAVAGDIINLVARQLPIRGTIHMGRVL